MIFIPQYAFAIVPDIPDDYFNTPEKLDWSIVFVTSRDDCSSNNQDALKFYTSLTRDYLYKFNFLHESFFVECISKDMMFSVVDKLTNYGDLTIVIPDYLMSIDDKHTTGSLGHYGSWIIDTIVSQAETFNIEDRDTAWTLSHELAHFSLNWKGYSHKVMGDAVHGVQKMYNDCKSYDTTLTNCAYLWDSFNTQSNNGFPVMSPDYVIQVADSMNPNTYSSTIYPTFITIDSITSQVNYGEYEYISGKLLNPDTNQGITNKKLIINAISPSGSTLVLNALTSNYDGIFSTKLQFNESGTWKILVNFEGDSQYASTFSDMTSNIIVSNIPQSTNNYGDTGSTSNQYDSDGDGIDDAWDSCIYDAENYNNYLDSDGCPDSTPNSQNQDGIIERQIESFDRIQVFYHQFSIIHPQDVFSITVKDQKLKTELSELINEKRRIDNQYQAIGNNLDNAIQLGNQGLFSESLQGYVKVENALSKLVNEYSQYQYRLNLFIDKNENSKSEEMSVWERNDVRIEQNRIHILEKDLQDKALQSQFKTKTEFQNLKDGIQQSEDALQQISPKYDDEEKLIDKSWIILDESKEKLRQRGYWIEFADEKFTTGDFVDAEYYYNIHLKPLYVEYQGIGDDLKEISSLIEQSKNTREEKSQTCFLFWCW